MSTFPAVECKIDCESGTEVTVKHYADQWLGIETYSAWMNPGDRAHQFDLSIDEARALIGFLSKAIESAQLCE